MASKEPYYRKTGAAFLAPEHVGSSIRWSVELRSNNRGLVFDAEANLTDCDKRIAWGGWGENGFAHIKKKLKRAIEELNLMHIAVEEAEAEYNKRKRRKKA